LIEGNPSLWQREVRRDFIINVFKCIIVLSNKKIRFLFYHKKEDHLWLLPEMVKTDERRG